MATINITEVFRAMCEHFAVESWEISEEDIGVIRCVNLSGAWPEEMKNDFESFVYRASIYPIQIIWEATVRVSAPPLQITE